MIGFARASSVTGLAQLILHPSQPRSLQAPDPGPQIVLIPLPLERLVLLVSGNRPVAFLLAHDLTACRPLRALLTECLDNRAICHD